MLAVSFCLNLSGSSLLVHKARISPEAFPGGPSYSRRSLLHNSFAAKAKALWAPVSSTGQRIRQPLASICLQLSFPIVFLYSEVCGWPKVFALLSPVFGLHWLEGSFFARPSFACLVVHLSRHICDGRLWNVNQQLSGSQFLQVMAC